MSESLFASLLHTLDKGATSQIAGSLGESEQSISKGLESSIATVLGGMASKSEDPGALRRILDLVPSSLGGISWSNLAAGLSDPTSPLIGSGNRILSGLFGSSESAVTTAVGRDSGVGPGTAGTLLAMAAPMVMSFLGKRVRDEGMSMNSLGTLLHKESATIRSALPVGLSDLFWPRAAAAAAAPVVAQSVRRESGFPSWGAALALGALALGCFWLFSHGRRPIANISTAATGTASRLADEASGVGDLVKGRLPNGRSLKIPDNPAESRMLVFVQDPNARVSQASWFDFDRLTFDSGSATLRPESKEQLDDVAAILVAFPNVRTDIAGYTDGIGNAERNLELSRARADSVKAELVARGVPPGRLSTEGYGEQNSAADNSTEMGRARNRRVWLLITQK